MSRVRQGIISHGFLEVDEVQTFNAVSLAVQQGPHLIQDGAFGVRDHIGGMALEQVGLDKKSRFAAAGTADDQDIFVPSVLGFLWAARHGDPLRLGEQDILRKVLVHVRGDVGGGAP